MWQNVYQGFLELSKSEQLKLFNAIKITLFPAVLFRLSSSFLFESCGGSLTARK
ncbi:hypothetical protein WAX78_03160 [Bacillus sp. FJAT-53711]|uniref:Uncharacterized protein n=1 Tax=Bacillus yunxiaonensis TaxID=3127665 RepID=A0ABU8FR51_9BACI